MLKSNKYEGKEGRRTVSLPPPIVCVFANEPPDSSKLSTDRWAIYEIIDENLFWRNPE